MQLFQYNEYFKKWRSPGLLDTIRNGGISYKGSNDASRNIVILVVQYKHTDSYGILLFLYASDVSHSVFDVLADGQVECMKALFVQRKR